MAVPVARLAKLREPTPASEVKKRKGPGGIELSYIDARYVFDTLDDVVGPADWQTKFERDPKGALRCGLGINVEDNGWVWKFDTGTESTMEAQKGEHSDSIKRAAVQWGIGRDLYDSAAERGTSVTPSHAPVATASSGWTCPVHRLVKVVPAGISKKTGKRYAAFEVCPECDEKPPRGGSKPRPMYTAPEPSEYVGMAPDEDDAVF
jgi:hypothetical protein